MKFLRPCFTSVNVPFSDISSGDEEKKLTIQLRNNTRRKASSLCNISIMPSPADLTIEAKGVCVCTLIYSSIAVLQHRQRSAVGQCSSWPVA